MSSYAMNKVICHPSSHIKQNVGNKEKIMLGLVERTSDVLFRKAKNKTELITIQSLLWISITHLYP
jgi:hypothetical protein